jgi:two-component system chemotaxis response regulator CheB
MVELVKALPADLPASLFIVIHIPPNAPSNLAPILRRNGQLEAVFPRDHEPIQRGYVYIAPPNEHMLLTTDNTIELNFGAYVNRTRPAIDPLFTSAAEAFGERVIGILLSGNLDDGTVGMGVIKEHGGIALVQDPDEAQFPGMPTSAIGSVNVDAVLPMRALIERVLELVGSAANSGESSGSHEAMNAVPGSPPGSAGIPNERGEPGPGLHFSCPDCGGVMYPVREGGLVRFRCEVGHVASPQTLLAEKNSAIEDGTWMVRRTLEEKARLLRYMSETARRRGLNDLAARHEEQAALAAEHVRLLQSVTDTLTSTEHNGF